MLVEHFDKLPAKTVTRKADRATLEARLREALPEQGMNALEVLDQLQQDVLSNIMHLDQKFPDSLIQVQKAGKPTSRRNRAPNLTKS
jgi:hypothetical protein